MKKELILIVDYGGQSNQTVAKRVRANKVYCEVVQYNAPLENVQKLAPDGLIFNGAFKELPEKYKAGATDFKKLAVPVLEVRGEISDLQLGDFLFKTCKVTGSFTMDEYIDEFTEQYKEKVAGKKVLCALSGGVDSSVSAILMSRLIPKENLICIFCDHGLMRKDEGDEVERVFGEKFNLNLIRVNCEDRFLKKLKGVIDPEKKRKIIGAEFIRVFEEEGKKIGKVDFLCQGTIYPDIIESGLGSGGMIKSHHNVGGLPDVIDFEEIIEPVRSLFKDEVRALGLALGIPDYLVNRQPFPGPGLGVRCIGEVNKPKLDILRAADAIFREEIAAAGLTAQVSQYFAVITDMRSVGVKNDERSYDYTVALRAVKTVDFMTAEWVDLPMDLLRKVSSRITSEVAGINRVVYDITSKPPATIEWE